jgi:hypothetical protein
MKTHALNKLATIKRIFPFEKSKHYFFGYYDKSPWSKNEKYFLGMRINFLGRHSTNKDSADILVRNNSTENVERIAKTNAWGWQQGSMLQWLGGDFNSKIIYNDLKNKKFVSVIKDIHSKKEKIINFPVFSITPDGKKGLGLNFSRLDDVRKGYGYPGLEDKYKKEKYPEKDGIYLIDLEKNTSKLIISLKDLWAYKNISSMEKGKHWVDHIGISPNGKRFCFFHRWYINNELFHTRLFTADLEGNNLFMFPDSGFYSHFFWKNNEELFGWGSVSENFGGIRKNERKFKLVINKILPIYRKIIPKSIRKRILPANYFILKDQTDKKTRLKVHYEDGHGTWIKNRYLLTDTYADKKHYRKIILYDLKTNSKKIVGKFYAIPHKKYIDEKIRMGYDNLGIRTDLHPRWDWKGDKICLDSVHEGYRNIYEIFIKKLIS